jgi:hypothetical protein
MLSSRESASKAGRDPKLDFAIFPISSISADGSYGQPGYASAKGAVESYSNTINGLLRPKGVRAIPLRIGTVRGVDLARRLDLFPPDADDAAIAAAVKRVLDSRAVLTPDTRGIATAWDVAQVVAHVALAGYALDGPEVLIDAGQNLARPRVTPLRPPASPPSALLARRPGKFRTLAPRVAPRPVISTEQLLQDDLAGSLEATREHLAISKADLERPGGHQMLVAFRTAIGAMFRSHWGETIRRMERSRAFANRSGWTRAETHCLYWLGVAYREAELAPHALRCSAEAVRISDTAGDTRLRVLDRMQCSAVSSYDQKLWIGHLLKGAAYLPS